MNCTTCQSLLVEFVYDELDEETHAAVAAALGDCAECQAELALLRQTMQVFDNIEPLEVPAKLHNDILRVARVAAAEVAPRRSWWAAFVASPAFSVAVSGVILVGGGTAFYQLTYGGDEPSYAPSAEVDTVAQATPSDDSVAQGLEADEEIEFAEELAASGTEPEEEPAAQPAERALEGRHSLDEAGRAIQAQAEAQSVRSSSGTAEGAGSADGAGGAGLGLSDNVDFGGPTGGSITGASSSGATPAVEGAPMQRGGSRDSSTVGNMMPSPSVDQPATPTAPQAQPEPVEEEDRAEERALNLGGNMGDFDRAREGDARTRQPNEIRPDSNDPHAPGSAATINEARAAAPSPEPVAMVPEPTEASAGPAAGTGYAAGGTSAGDEWRQEEVLAEAEEAEEGARYEDAAELDLDMVRSAAPAREQQYGEETETADTSSLLDDEYMDGIDHFDNGRWGRANRALRRFLEVAPQSDSRRAVARYLVGASYYRVGEYSNAERELRRFLDGHPGHDYADEAQVLLDAIGQETSPTNRRNAPAPALDSMEAEPR